MAVWHHRPSLPKLADVRENSEIGAIEFELRHLPHPHAPVCAQRCLVVGPDEKYPLTPWLQSSQLRKHRGSQALSAVPVYKSLGSVAKNSLQQSNGLVFLQMLYSIANP
ncbi:hypothetical protein M2375_004047 [Comamonas sp. BIGb0152]|uniref:hypothetical protein n=1 Tax=Comamonas sp. BIGb0152 TaxID=2940601 RepID=UPI0021692E6E|nr:hypothetical protein [Comamonas sp. BIGb0152]MCS4295800.1 hypothetical protein [Comamonas sp. BIGb0152]